MAPPRWVKKLPRHTSAGRQTITAPDPLPDDHRQPLKTITPPGQVRTNLS
jgi:hypothetical protein